MSSENMSDILKILALPLIGAVIGYLLKYYLDKKQQFTTKNAEIKRTMYQDFVDMMISFFEGTKREKPTTDDVVDKIYAFYKQYVLYASPKVIRSFSDLMQYFYKNESEQKQLTKNETAILLKMLTTIFKHMRKDIGLSNFGLGRDGEKLMRAILKDYDEVMSIPWWRKFRFIPTLQKPQIESSIQADDSVELAPADNRAANVSTTTIRKKKSKRKKRR